MEAVQTSASKGFKRYDRLKMSNVTIPTAVRQVNFFCCHESGVFLYMLIKTKRYTKLVISSAIRLLDALLFPRLACMNVVSSVCFRVWRLREVVTICPQRD